MKAIVLALLALFLSQSAFAQYNRGHGGYYGHGGRGYYGPRVGFYFGAPYPWVPPPTYYYPPTVIYSPPVVTVREPVYIEQSEVIAAPIVQSRQTLEPGYWYYCQERQGYYPAVDSCPGPWQKVAPSSSR